MGRATTAAGNRDSQPGQGASQYSPTILLEADEQKYEQDKDQPQGQEEELDFNVIWKVSREGGHWGSRRRHLWPGQDLGSGRSPPGGCTPSPSTVVTSVRLVPLVPPAAVDAMMCTL